MTIASALLLALAGGLVVFDWATFRGKNRRGLFVEVAAFAAAAYFIALPDSATALAHRVGIGRGVDFLLYPTVLWLIRETLLARRHRLEQAERLTDMARAIAVAGVQRVGAPPAPADVAPGADERSAAAATSAPR